MTLYLKYRPKNLDELDSAAVSQSLKKIVSKKSIPHAFLFAGPKGIGKTSAARILAKIINCTNLKGVSPCGKCSQCISITEGSNLDVIEMDAASHRGIDDVRLLRDAVKLAPVSAKKKIYIIDEVHMLTTEASNALLKTLEEPPEHVVFILATTNPEKLIETIRSRTTLIPFKKAEVPEIVTSLKRVVKGEKIKIDDASLKLIAKASDGSFRDAIKTLEQLVAEERPLSRESLEEFLFRNKSFDLDKFVSALTRRNLKQLLAEVEELDSKGVSIEVFLESLIKRLRGFLLSKVGVGEEGLSEFSKEDLVKLIDLMNQAYGGIAGSPIEELPLELALISWCGEESGKGGRGNKVNGEVRRNSLKGDEGLSVQTQEHVLVEGEMEVRDDAWKNILALIKPVNASMEALLRAARPVAYNGKVLTLGVYYKFHKERLEDEHHRRILEDIVERVLQAPTKVTCVLVEPPPKKVIEGAKSETVLTEGKDADIIKAAEEIFGN
jgi:DNA polymerase-3 subunit gamma/tau